MNFCYGIIINFFFIHIHLSIIYIWLFTSVLNTQATTGKKKNWYNSMDKHTHTHTERERKNFEIIATKNFFQDNNSHHHHISYCLTPRYFIQTQQQQQKIKDSR